MAIQRWYCKADHPVMDMSERGEWVLYTDHLAEVRERERKAFVNGAMTVDTYADGEDEKAYERRAAKEYPCE